VNSLAIFCDFRPHESGENRTLENREKRKLLVCVIFARAFFTQTFGTAGAGKQFFRTQNLPGITPRVGSTPSSGTIFASLPALVLSAS
jgi:hypothetical protein